MCKPSKYINEICPECHPASSVKSKCEFTGEVDEVNEEYLYQCCKCGARIWVDDQWAKEHAIDENLDFEKEAAARTTAKEYELGSKVKLQISLVVEEYSQDDLREILSFIATSSRDFYLTVGKKLKNPVDIERRMN